MHADNEGRAFFEAAFEPHVSFADLQAWLQRDDSVFDERVQVVGGPQVMVLHG